MPASGSGLQRVTSSQVTKSVQPPRPQLVQLLLSGLFMGPIELGCLAHAVRVFGETRRDRLFPAGPPPPDRGKFRDRAGAGQTTPCTAPQRRAVKAGTTQASSTGSAKRADGHEELTIARPGPGDRLPLTPCSAAAPPVFFC